MELIKLKKSLCHRIPLLGGSITRTLLINSAKAKEIHKGKSPIADYKTYLETIEKVKFEDLSWKLKGVLILWVGFLGLVGVIGVAAALLITYLALMVIFQPILPPQIKEWTQGLEQFFEILPSFIQTFTLEGLITSVEGDDYVSDFISNIITGWQMNLLIILVFIFLTFCYAFISIPFKILYANLSSVFLTNDEKIILKWLKDPNSPQDLNPPEQKGRFRSFYTFNHFHPGMNVESFYIAIVDLHYYLATFLSILSVFFVWTAIGFYLANKINYFITNLVLAFGLAIGVIILLWRTFSPYLSLKEQASFHVKGKIIEATNKIHLSHSTNEDDICGLAIRLKLLYFQSIKRDIDQTPMIPVSRYIKIYGGLTVLITLITIFI